MDEINRLKTHSDYAEDARKLASVHRVLERLWTTAINWRMAQTPPLLTSKVETICDRRVSREEERRLLDTALREMNTATHQYVGELLHDRIIGAARARLPARWDTC